MSFAAGLLPEFCKSGTQKCPKLANRVYHQRLGDSFEPGRLKQLSAAFLEARRVAFQPCDKPLQHAFDIPIG
ncbi:hypothetical protein QMN58_32055, partial [Escherichia coli]|nr:hypothetical protein [Escherichia coli]